MPEKHKGKKVKGNKYTHEPPTINPEVIAIEARRVLLRETRLRARNAFKDSLIPEFARERLLELSDEAHTVCPVDQGAYLRLAENSIATIIPPYDRKESARRNLDGNPLLYTVRRPNSPAGMAYINPYEIDEVIKLQHAGFISEERARELLLESFLELQSNGLHIQMTTPLTQFDPAASYNTLLPAMTVAEYTKARQNEADYYRNQGSTIRDFTQADLDILQFGYASQAVERISNMGFTIPSELLVIDKARSTVLQTLLLIISYGREEFTKAGIEKADDNERAKSVFQMGIVALQKKMQAARETVRAANARRANNEMMQLSENLYYLGEISALQFLYSYYQETGIDVNNDFDGSAFKNATHALFDILGNSTLDGFYEKASEETRNAFQILVTRIARMIDIRKQQRPPGL